MFENESVTNVTNVTAIFRPRHALRKIWDGGGFCRYHCSVLRLDSMMCILSFDYARCAWDLDGLHLLRWSCTSKTQKTRKRGESSVPFVINEKFRWLFLALFRAEMNKKSMVQSSISDERTMLFILSNNLIFCPKVHQMFWSAQMGLHRKTLSQVPW